jgi:ABC-2 type transport system ATP-binding protein
LSAETPIVRIAGLTRKFDHLVAVNALDLEVSRGEIFGLVGPDGAGKTTTLRMLCGLMTPTSGRISVDGRDVGQDLDHIKDAIGYMAQRFALYGDLTVSENMRFYGDLFGIPEEKRDPLTARLLQMTRMEPFQQRRAGQLSGGMKQKLALMCTLLHFPKVLFLDEPTNGVDPVSRRDFWAILYQLVKDGLTVFVTTAYLDEAERCNRVGLMHRGRLIRCDAPAALKSQIQEECYDVSGADLHAVREALQSRPEVVSVEPCGATLHMFLNPDVTPEGLEMAGVTFRKIDPSLEDVFIAEIAKAARAYERN